MQKVVHDCTILHTNILARIVLKNNKVLRESNQISNKSFSNFDFSNSLEDVGSFE